MLLPLSCVTLAPERPQEYWLRYLPARPQIYMDIRPGLHRPFFNRTFRRHSLETVVSRASRMVLGIQVEGIRGELRGVVLGDFPQGMGGFYLDMDGAFTREKREIKQWSGDGGFYVTIVEDGVVAVATEPFQNQVGFSQAMISKVEELEVPRPLSVIIPNPGESFLGQKGENFLPLGEVILYFEPQDDKLVGTMIVPLKEGPNSRLGMVFTKLFWKTLRVTLLSAGEVSEPEFIPLERGGIAQGWTIDSKALLGMVGVLFTGE